MPTLATSQALRQGFLSNFPETVNSSRMLTFRRRLTPPQATSWPLLNPQQVVYNPEHCLRYVSSMLTAAAKPSTSCNNVYGTSQACSRHCVGTSSWTHVQQTVTRPQRSYVRALEHHHGRMCNTHSPDHNAVKSVPRYVILDACATHIHQTATQLSPCLGTSSWTHLQHTFTSASRVNCKSVRR